MTTRVLHYGLSTNRGGIETYILRLAQHVQPNEFHFDYVFNNVGTPCFYDELSALTSQFYPLTPRRFSPTANRRDLERLFNREHFDILHCHLNTLSYVEPIKAALRHGCKVLVHSHNSGASTSVVTNTLHRVHCATLRRDRLYMVAVSELAGEWMFGRGADYQVINNGVDVERFAYSEDARRRVRRQLGLEGQFVIGNIGAFLFAKNHEFLLRVFAAMKEVRHRSALVLVGTGPLEASVRTQATRLGIADQVHFLGTRTDVPDLLSAMDCMVFPSRYEGFPLAVLEAQSSGLPCWIADTITPEVAVTELCTLLSLDSTPAAWAAQILNREPNTSRDRAHRAVTAAGFSVQASTLKIEDVYRRMTS